MMDIVMKSAFFSWTGIQSASLLVWEKKRGTTPSTPATAPETDPCPGTLACDPKKSIEAKNAPLFFSHLHNIGNRVHTAKKGKCFLPRAQGQSNPWAAARRHMCQWKKASTPAMCFVFFLQMDRSADHSISEPSMRERDRRRRRRRRQRRTCDRPVDRELPAAESADDLLAGAMACVAWDGTVDTARLSSLEFAHDEAAMRRVVTLAGAIADSPKHVSRSIAIGGAEIYSHWGHDPFVMERRAAGWYIEDATGDTATITDEQLALYGALCARHKRFSTSWAGVDTTSAYLRSKYGPPRPAPNADLWIEWRDMWMSRVVNALATASGAWAGREIMRTQYLARALLAVLEARNARGPLASLTDGTAQGEAPEPTGSTAEATRLREAIAIAAAMPPCVTFVDQRLPAAQATTYDADNAIGLLKFIINATQRIYETQPFYMAVIAPAEYDVLCQNAPAGAFQ